MRNHAHFSGAKSRSVTSSRSRKYCMMSSTCSFSSLSTNSSTALLTGSAVISSYVTPHVVSTKNESPGLTYSSTPSIESNLIQSSLSSSAARIICFSTDKKKVTPSDRVKKQNHGIACVNNLIMKNEEKSYAFPKVRAFIEDLHKT
jgi:hypothetical protein